MKIQITVIYQKSEESILHYSNNKHRITNTIITDFKPTAASVEFRLRNNDDALESPLSIYIKPSETLTQNDESEYRRIIMKIFGKIFPVEKFTICFAS